MKQVTKIVAVLMVTAVMPGCKDMAKDLQTMAQLQDTLSRRYNTRQINIEISNGKTLFVSLTNTIYNDSLPEQKQRIACEIGNIVKVIDKEKKIESGSVSFVKSSQHAIVTTSTSVSFDMRLDSLSNNPENDSIQKPVSHDL